MEINECVCVIYEGHSFESVWIQDRDLWFCSPQVHLGPPEQVSFAFSLGMNVILSNVVITRHLVRDPEEQAALAK